MSSSVREFIDLLRVQSSTDYAVKLAEARDAQLENEARALAIREATDFVWENLQEDSGAEDLTYERDLCDRLLALLSTTHADAQATHDKRVRAEAIREHNYFYQGPYEGQKTGFYYCLCGWQGPDRMSYWGHLEVAELRAEPPSKSGEGRSK